MGGKDRSMDSICEKSMKMVVNIIRLFSFSIAKASLGSAGYQMASTSKCISSVTGSSVLANEPRAPLLSASNRSQEPWRSSKRVSFLMQPGGDDGSCVVHEENSLINGKASAYIRKVHEKNLKAVHETKEPASHIVLPPPPPPTPTVK